ncbi:Autotransporter-associated beta strand repeat protein [Planctomycetes bacterium CA13]|uniref:Autotransporter-associated beta strand repeat protein n=1 Tax=Novipirellula herctigrandis TaxID=2527986 RepID=A0A5C5ZDV7_9BACT|nr:Autotransporter-associated beta strand repeat protein [Planctomycetes bacterium CA13]
MNLERNSARPIFGVLLLAVVLCQTASGQYTANSLAELRSFASAHNNATITLAAGDYWIDGDHIANPTSSEPTFLELTGTGNTYNLTGANIKLDTRKLDGFGRALGHDSGIEVVKISGSNNTVNGLSLTGYDVDVSTPAQRHADWAAVYVQMTGTSNTVNGAHVLTRGSSPYGLGDVFGKGARVSPQGWDPGPALDENGDPVGDGVGLPWHGHNKTSAFQVIDTVDAVINDMHLDVKTYGHGFFVQGTATNTTLTNSTVTGELFSSNDVIATDLYQEYGFTSHGNELPADMMISGAEDGVRMYNGPSGLTVDNVVVTNMRTGFSTALGKGDINLNNVEAYGTENAFNFKSSTTITNAKGDITHGPLLHTPYDSASNTSIDIELVGGVPEGVDWAVAYVAGNNLDITINRDLAAGALPADSLVRFGQVFFDNWRDSKHPTGPEDHGDNNFDYINSEFHNNTNQMLVLGNEVTGNTGSSQAGVISNGKDNQYDGVTMVFDGTRLTAQHVNGLGNGGTDADGTLDSNGSIVFDGSTLEIQAGIRITNEKLVITGDGVDGKGALYSEGSTTSGDTRFGSSNNSDESTVFLDGDASIGVGGAGKGMLVGRIQGTGDLTKRGAGELVMSKSSNYDGDLIVAEGHVTARSNVVRQGLSVAADASISAIGNNAFNTTGDVDLDGTLDLNSRGGNFISVLSGTIGRLNGSGRITSSNTGNASSGGTLNFAGNGADGLFSGAIDGAVSLVKSGANTQTLAGTMTHTGTTIVTAGHLFVNGTHTGGDDYTITADGFLGGNGAIDSAVLVETGGHLAPGASAGSLFVSDLMLSSGSFFDVEVGGTTAGSEYDQLTTDTAMLDGILSISLLEADESAYLPLLSDSFTVLLSNNALSGVFENVVSGERLATVAGEGTFVVTYGGGTNSVVLSNFLVSAVPEPSSAAMLGMLGISVLIVRRRKRSHAIGRVFPRTESQQH